MMTPLSESKGMLVRRWGEMGGYWGINRTMAEIHALLFVTAEPLCTDDVMEQLKISRGNASMNLRGLVDWGLIRRVHKLGDRKEYFEADTDVWHMFETIMRERRRREVEPIIATIDRALEVVAANGGMLAAPAAASEPGRAVAAGAGTTGPAGGVDAAAEKLRVAEFRRRLEELRGFLSTMGSLFELVLNFGNKGIGELARSMTPAAEAAGSPGAKAGRRTGAQPGSQAGTAAAGNGGANGARRNGGRPAARPRARR